MASRYVKKQKFSRFKSPGAAFTIRTICNKLLILFTSYIMPPVQAKIIQPICLKICYVETKGESHVAMEQFWECTFLNLDANMKTK